MNSVNNSFQQRFQNFFWWLPPISLVADVIAITAALNAKAEVASLSSSTYPDNLLPIPSVGPVAISDMIVITGILTLFGVIGVCYQAFQLSEKRGDGWAMIGACFVSTFTIWLYLRLWLGENWFFYCFIAIFCIIAIALSLISHESPTISYQQQKQVRPLQQVSKIYPSNARLFEEPSKPYKIQFYIQHGISKKVIASTTYKSDTAPCSKGEAYQLLAQLASSASLFFDEPQGPPPVYQAIEEAKKWIRGLRYALNTSHTEFLAHQVQFEYQSQVYLIKIMVKEGRGHLSSLSFLVRQ